MLSGTVALPAAIPVRYTEEEAGYVSFRPVVRQTFRLHELLDMVLSVTGKEPERIRQILRSGTVVFHFYRYWWQGFEVGEDELQALLAQFPDSDPARAFRAAACTKAFIASEVSSPRHFSIEIARAAASRKRFLRRRSFWAALLAAAVAGPLAYDVYSYMHHADLFRLELTAGTRANLVDAAASLAPRDLRRELTAVSEATHVLFACSRTA
ncbi:MAG TPA: hypothetical protein VGG55_04950, partial [Candidatus Acidoferrales bacterium]